MPKPPAPSMRSMRKSPTSSVPLCRAIRLVISSRAFLIRNSHAPHEYRVGEREVQLSTAALRLSSHASAPRRELPNSHTRDFRVPPLVRGAAAHGPSVQCSEQLYDECVQPSRADHLGAKSASRMWQRGGQE